MKHCYRLSVSSVSISTPVVLLNSVAGLTLHFKHLCVDLHPALPRMLDVLCPSGRNEKLMVSHRFFPSCTEAAMGFFQWLFEKVSAAPCL